MSEDILDGLFDPPPPPAPEEDAKSNFGPAIHDGVLRYVSVSQIKDFDREEDRGCPTRWYFQKKLRQKKETGKGARVGKEQHAQVEHYLRTGEKTLSPIIMAGVQFLPAPLTERPGILVENPFGGLSDPNDPLSPIASELEAAGVPVVGYIDIENHRGEFIDEQGVLQAERFGVVEVIDHKFTKSIQKYGKPASALIRTSQMPGYGKLMLNRHPHLEFVRLSHNTFQTEGRRWAVKSTALIPAEQIVARWKKVESVVAEMRDVAREENIEKVPQNPEACDAYGGCPFKAQCPRSIETIFTAHFGAKEQTVSLFDQLKKDFGMGVAAPTPVTTSTVAPAPGAATQALADASQAIAERVAAEQRAKASVAAQALAVEAAKTAPAPVPDVPPVGSSVTFKVKAREARQGHRYGVIMGGKVVETFYNARTRGGLHFSTGVAGDAPFYLQDDEEVIVLGGTALPTAIVPPDAPQSGVSGPKAEALPADAVVPPAVAEAAAKITPSTAIPNVSAPAPVTPPTPPANDTPAPEADAPKKGRGRPKSPGTIAKEAVEEAIEKGTSVVVSVVDGQVVVGESAGRPLSNDVEVSEANAEILRLEGEVAKLETALAASKAGSSDAGTYEKELVEARAEIAKLKADYEVCSSSLKRGSEINAEFARQNDDLKQANEIMKDSMVKAEAENENLKSTIAKLNADREAYFAKAVVAPAAGITLYVDALPVKGEARPLAAYIEKVTGTLLNALNEQAKVQGKKPVEDIRLHPDLQYRKWEPTLGAVVRQYPPEPGVYFVATSRGMNEIARVVTEHLEPLAAVVVKGGL